MYFYKKQNKYEKYKAIISKNTKYKIVQIQNLENTKIQKKNQIQNLENTKYRKSKLSIRKKKANPMFILKRNTQFAK